MPTATSTALGGPRNRDETTYRIHSRADINAKSGGSGRKDSSKDGNAHGVLRIRVDPVREKDIMMLWLLFGCALKVRSSFLDCVKMVQ